MIKEYLIAITLGILLGFGATGGYFSLKSSKKTQDSQSAQTEPTTIPDSDTDNSPSSPTNDSPSSALIIENPENYSIVSNSKTEITGSTTPKSTIVISTPVNSYLINTDDSGAFSTKIDLESGFNIIDITSIDPQNVQSELELVITYSTAKI